MCPLIYNGIATDPSGGYRPCCRFDQLHSFHGKIGEYRSSNLWKSLEDDFLNDKFPPGCWDCEKNEDANGTSKRLREVSNYKAKYKKDSLDNEHLKNTLTKETFKTSPSIIINIKYIYTMQTRALTQLRVAYSV